MLPRKPTDELSDEQLDAVAGGDTVGTFSTLDTASTAVSCIASLSTLSTVASS
jgi:hypothetical protein